MKKIRIVSSAILLSLSIITMCIMALATEGSNKVDVVFLHDLHSHLNTFATVEGTESVSMGGFARIKTLINGQMEKNPETLVLDGGDFSMGTLVQSVYASEASELRMMGALGIDVTTFGNHEFDYGAKGVSDMLSAAKDSGDVLPSVLLCNVDWEAMSKAGLTEDQQLIKDSFESFGVKDYVVVEKDNVRIGIIGVMGRDSVNCIANCPITFADPVESVKRVVAQIQETEDVDMLVCVSHSGTNEDEDKSEDEILAKAVPELDLIISGHTHTRLDRPIQCGDTYIVSCDEYGKYLGTLSMEKKEDGRWNMSSYRLIEVTSEIEPDPEIQAKVDYFMSMVDSRYLAHFGYTKDQILCTNEVQFASPSDVGALHTEVNLGSIIADAYTYAVENAPDFDGIPVDVTVAPAGTIRDTYAKGNVTVENVFNSFSLGIGRDGIPGYPLISVYLTGKELKLVAEIDSSISDLMPTARLYTDGLYWHYNPNRMILNKATEVFIVNGKGERVELEDEKLYRVVTDYYSSQMLGGVTDMSFGLLSIIPKDKDGNPIKDYADATVMVEGQELKAWAAIAGYMESFADTDGDGVGNVPAVYGTTEGRKVVENSKNLTDLLKNPNQFFWMILAVAAVVLVLLVLIVLLMIKGIRFAVRKIVVKTK